MTQSARSLLTLSAGTVAFRVSDYLSLSPTDYLSQSPNVEL